jgi:hypothetical protein
MPSQPPSDSELEANQAIEQEILQGRKYSLADAISQEGGDFLKGESPIPKLVQVKSAIKHFINLHLSDSAGALQATLLTTVQSDDVICSRHFDTPLQALTEMLHPLIAHDVQLREFVRQVDMRWGQMYDERPHFERPGHPPHPDDEYTIESVRSQLQALMTAVQQHSS